jgi:hypothetical protein
MEIKVNYDEAKKNHVRADAEKAVQIFLSGEVGTSIMIFPQALNPMLKALESLCIWKQAVVVPHSDNGNKPVYIIVKVGNQTEIDGIRTAEA